jgi:phage/plasmid-like protein (TIGR03299 family)
MAHGLEISDEGDVAFALRGDPAWHGLASHIFDADEVVTTTEMLDAAHLSDWNVRLESVSGHAPEGYNFVTEPYMVLRDNPFTPGQVDVLATVGERYKELQNEDLFAFGDNILDSGASWESAGSIRDGRVVFGSLVLPREVVLDPNGAADTTTMYLLVNTSHDGTTAVQASVTPVRVVCQNTLNFALRGVKQSYKIRHTTSVDGRVAAAREALGIAFTYVDEFEAEAQALYQTAITDAQFTDLVNTLYPKPEADAKGALTKWENKITLIGDIYNTSPTTETIRGTAWGAVNALTERLDWFRSARAGKSDNMLIAASGFDPVINAEKGKILAAAKSLLLV